MRHLALATNSKIGRLGLLLTEFQYFRKVKKKRNIKFYYLVLV